MLPVYLGELAPPRLRGTFGTFTQLAMVIGILAADLVALGAASFTLFAVSFLTAAVMLVCAGLLPLAPTPQSALAEDARIARMSPGGMDPSDGGRWLGAVELCKNLYLLDDEAARRRPTPLLPPSRRDRRARIRQSPTSRRRNGRSAASSRRETSSSRTRTRKKGPIRN